MRDANSFRLQYLLPINSTFIFFASLITATLSFSCGDLDLLTILQFKSDCQYKDWKDEGYKLVSQWVDSNNSYHYLGAYLGDETFYVTETSEIVKCLHVIIEFHTQDSFQIKFIDNDNPRWEIPEEDPFPHFKSESLFSMQNSCCEVTVEDGPLAFIVKHRQTQEIFLDTRNRPLIYSDKYIEISTKLSSRDVYGFGERSYSFRLPPGTYTIWARDEAAVNENGRGGGNLYGQHPVGLFRGKEKTFYMSLLRNSNAMDIILDSEPSLTYKVIGGVIDLVYFVGDKSPETCLRAYYKYLGGYTLMPFWAMGYHHSKLGFSRSAQLVNTIEFYSRLQIPIDAVWSDIEYLDNTDSFTISKDRFTTDEMALIGHKGFDRRWIPAIRAGVHSSIKERPGRVSNAEQEGIIRNVFVKDEEGSFWLGGPRRNMVYFPDFFNPNTERYWSDMLEGLYSKQNFAGVWLDANEPSVAKEFEAKRDHTFKNKETKPGYPEMWLPYTPGSRPLDYKTLDMTATYYGGHKEYNVHGLYGLLQSKATFEYLQKRKRLPFIVSRNTFPGSGKYAAHWTGDIGSQWITLQYSLASIFSFQLFGIPFVGADICGTYEEKTADICARWIQLGAFYPFARNYVGDPSRSQDPWSFLTEPFGRELFETTRVAIKTRYSILKWYYGLYIKAKGLEVVFKPLFFEFPDEEALYLTRGPTEFEFLLGNGVLVIPKLTANDDDVLAYFPKASWFDVFTGEKIIEKDRESRSLLISARYNVSAPMFLRAGHLLYRQNADYVLSTQYLNNVFELVVALEKDSRSLNSKVWLAQGTIPGVSNYNEYIIYNKCVEKDCLYDIKVKLHHVQDAEGILRIDLEPRDSSLIDLEGIFLYRLQLYGIPKEFDGTDDFNIKLLSNDDSVQEEIIQHALINKLEKRRT